METVYFAKWILAGSGDLLVNGAIVVDDSRITSIGSRSAIKRSSNARFVNLGDTLVLPGFINMHTHLDALPVRGYTKPHDETFAAWTAKVNSKIRSFDQAHMKSGIQLSVRELIAQGITSVADSSRNSQASEYLKQEAIRSWTIHEMHSDRQSLENDIFDNCKKLISGADLPERMGIGPYALYSLSPAMQREIINFATNNKLLWMCHIAESSEELQAFSEKAGDLYFHATRKQDWLHGDAPAGSMSYALENGLIPNGGICVHCNYVNGPELEKLAALDASIVMCYTYTQSTGHKNFPLDVALKRNCNICIGTEGVAPHGTFSIFDELFALKTAYPHIPAKELLLMPTRNAAKALGMEHELGSLDTNKLADFIAVRFAVSPEDDILETALMEEVDIVLVVINGEEIVVNY